MLENTFITFCALSTAKGMKLYMVKKIIFYVLIISVLSACSQQDAKEEPITLEEVETAITEQGLVLNKADLPSENAFIQELNGVSPKAYFIDGATLSLYVFSSVDVREKGMDDFEEKTATAELVAHKTYTNKNILVFYELGNEESHIKLNSAINDLD